MASQAAIKLQNTIFERRHENVARSDIDAWLQRDDVTDFLTNFYVEYHQPYNVGLTIAQLAVILIRKMRALDLQGYPADMAGIEEWAKALDHMLVSLQMIVDDNFTADVDGLRIFGERLGHLWD